MSVQKDSASNDDTRNMLTDIVSQLYCSREMPGLPHITSLLRRQLKTDRDKLIAINDELKKLHEAYLTYRDLVKERASLEERLRITASIAGADTDTRDLLRDWDGLTIGSLEDERKNIPLWKAIKEIVRHTERIRIVDLENQLKSFGYTVTRQAIESAIRTHHSTFRESKHGREKFVSLK